MEVFERSHCLVCNLLPTTFTFISVFIWTLLCRVWTIFAEGHQIMFACKYLQIMGFSAICSLATINADPGAKKYKSYFEVLDYLDNDISQVMDNIPLLITEAKASVLKARRLFNYQRISVATGLSVANIIKEFATSVDDNTMTYGKIFNAIGNALVNGGYAGGRIARVKSLSLNCGMQDFEDVIDSNDVFFKIQQTDKLYISEALSQWKHPLSILPAHLMPESLAFTYENFVSSINASLSCILGDPESLDLKLELKLLADLLQHRLQVRDELFKDITEDFVALYYS